MSEGLNRVTLVGNLGADPDLRSTSNGQSVMNMRLATTETYLDRNNERQEKVEWHNVTLWGKRAEALHKFLEKGSRILVEGKLQTSSYEKEGVKHYRTDVVAINILLLGGGKGNSERRESGGPPRREVQPREQAREQPRAPQQATFDDVPDGDIPF